MVTVFKNKMADSGAKAIFQNCFKFGIKTRYIQTREKDVSINYPMHSSSSSTSNIPKLPQLILSVMLRWKSSTRQSKKYLAFFIDDRTFYKVNLQHKLLLCHWQYFIWTTLQSETTATTFKTWTSKSSTPWQKHSISYRTFCSRRKWH